MLLYLALDETNKRRAMADPLNQISQAAGVANTLVSTNSSHDAQDAGRKRVKAIFRVKGGVSRKISHTALSSDAKAPRANHLLHSEFDMKRICSLRAKGRQKMVSANARKSSETVGTGTHTGTSMNATPWKAKRASMRSGTSAAHANVNKAAGTGKSEQDVVHIMYTYDATTNKQPRSLQLLLFAGACTGASVELTGQPVQLQSQTSEGDRSALEAAQGQERRDSLDVMNPLVISLSGHGQIRLPTAEAEPPSRRMEAEVAEVSEANARAFI
jgi:hypothetical protein